MARKIGNGYLDQFKEDGPILRLDCWFTTAESDQWDEWIKGGTWVAEKGKDFTDMGAFSDEIKSRAEAANLDWEMMQSASLTETPGVFSHTVTFRFRNFPETVADLQAIWDDADEAAA